ncbi:unnamed protein product [Prorocentrum cordatum]|uniref:Uncharacterized protein n=1 Tax=Prorocentrum cordatum TaxID=2364126 RepID=A0ABN9S539_9DINO|nr:unnamed protein product [Polarella glacialis]
MPRRSGPGTHRAGAHALWEGRGGPGSHLGLGGYVPGRGAAAVYVDVTIRCPPAARYEHADTRLGEAASEAAASKRAPYGSIVLPIAFETYGRIGAESLRSLDLLAVHAGCCMRDAWAAPRLLPKWRAALERLVHFAAADVDLLSFGCDPTLAEARAARGRVSGAVGAVV